MPHLYYNKGAALNGSESSSYDEEESGEGWGVSHIPEADPHTCICLHHGNSMSATQQEEDTRHK